MSGFTLKAEGLKLVEETIEAVRARMERIVEAGGQPAWFGDVARFEAAQAEQTFATEGAASGEKWPDLTEGVGNMDAYVKWKGRNWPNRKMNVWRGDTRDSFRNVSDKDHISRIGSGRMQFGSKAKLAPKMHEGTSSGTWQKAFLKERSPVFPKGSRSRQTRDAASGQFRSGRERVHKGRVVKGRNWFVFWYKQIPARPLARKSATQVRHLKLAFAKAIVGECSRATGGRANAFSRGLAKLAGRMRPDPRA